MAKSSSSAASRSLASARRKRAPTRSKALSFKVGNGIVKTIPGGSKQPRYKGPGGTIKTAGSRTIPRPTSIAIERYQTPSSAADLPTSETSFAGRVRDIVRDFQPKMRIDAAAISAVEKLPHAALAAVLESAHGCAAHASRTTIQAKDVQVTLAIVHALRWRA